MGSWLFRLQEELRLADDAGKRCADFGGVNDVVDAGLGRGYHLACGRAASLTARREQLAPPQVVIIEGMASLKELLKPLAEDGAAMTREQAAGALEEILTGAVPDVETAAMLTVMATRGEQAPELAGFVQVMRERVTPMPLTQA